MTAPTSYCSVTDVESILSAPGVTGAVDDFNDGTRGAAETADITSAIQRAAAMEINFNLGQRYDLAANASHPWLKWTNAILAAYTVMSRRNQSASKGLISDIVRIREQLRSLNRYEIDLYDMPSQFDDMPAASNMEVERWRTVQPVRVSQQESTRAVPEGDIKRRVAGNIPWDV